MIPCNKFRPGMRWNHSKKRRVSVSEWFVIWKLRFFFSHDTQLNGLPNVFFDFFLANEETRGKVRTVWSENLGLARKSNWVEMRSSCQNSKNLRSVKVLPKGFIASTSDKIWFVKYNRVFSAFFRDSAHDDSWNTKIEQNFLSTCRFGHFRPCQKMSFSCKSLSGCLGWVWKSSKQSLRSMRPFWWVRRFQVTNGTCCTGKTNVLNFLTVHGTQNCQVTELEMKLGEVSWY